MTSNNIYKRSSMHELGNLGEEVEFLVLSYKGIVFLEFPKNPKIQNKDLVAAWFRQLNDEAMRLDFPNFEDTN
jgi:hypothetical protein